MTVELTLKNSTKILVRGSRYIYPGEVYECSEEEADVRAVQEKGMWDREDVSEKDKDKTPEKDADSNTVKKTTPTKKVGDEIQK